MKTWRVFLPLERGDNLTNRSVPKFVFLSLLLLVCLKLELMQPVMISPSQKALRSFLLNSAEIPPLPFLLSNQTQSEKHCRLFNLKVKWAHGNNSLINTAVGRKCQFEFHYCGFQTKSLLVFNGELQCFSVSKLFLKVFTWKVVGGKLSYFFTWKHINLIYDEKMFDISSFRSNIDSCWVSETFIYRVRNVYFVVHANYILEYLLNTDVELHPCVQ